jgi:predicted Zn-dependent protease
MRDQVVQDIIRPVYKDVAHAWNSHVNGSTDWKALAALAAGVVLALVVAQIVAPAFHGIRQCSRRTAIQLQCCVVVHIAPERLPIIRTTNKPGQRKSAQRAEQVRASPAQWNAMRMKLGSSVPDQSIEDYVKNYGDDVQAAAEAFFGPGYKG